MSSSCALVPRAGAAHATRTVGGRAPPPPPPRLPSAVPPRVPATRSRRGPSPLRARASAAGSARDARARPRAGRIRAGTSGVSALSVEDRQNDGGDGAGEPSRRSSSTPSRRRTDGRRERRGGRSSRYRRRTRRTRRRRRAFSGRRAVHDDRGRRRGVRAAVPVRAGGDRGDREDAREKTPAASVAGGDRKRPPHRARGVDARRVALGRRCHRVDAGPGPHARRSRDVTDV